METGLLDPNNRRWTGALAEAFNIKVDFGASTTLLSALPDGVTFTNGFLAGTVASLEDEYIQLNFSGGGATYAAFLFFIALPVLDFKPLLNKEGVFNIAEEAPPSSVALARSQPSRIEILPAKEFPVKLEGDLRYTSITRSLLSIEVLGFLPHGMFYDDVNWSVKGIPRLEGSFSTEILVRFEDRKIASSSYGAGNEFVSLGSYQKTLSFTIGTEEDILLVDRAELGSTQTERLDADTFTADPYLNFHSTSPGCVVWQGDDVSLGFYFYHPVRLAVPGRDGVPVDNDWPEGLEFDPVAQTLSGTLTKAGRYEMAIEADWEDPRKGYSIHFLVILCLPSDTPRPQATPESQTLEIIPGQQKEYLVWKDVPLTVQVKTNLSLEEMVEALKDEDGIVTGSGSNIMAEQPWAWVKVVDFIEQNPYYSQLPSPWKVVIDSYWGGAGTALYPTVNGRVFTKIYANSTNSPHAVSSITDNPISHEIESVQGLLSGNVGSSNYVELTYNVVGKINWERRVPAPAETNYPTTGPLMQSRSLYTGAIRSLGESDGSVLGLQSQIPQTHSRSDDYWSATLITRSIFEVVRRVEYYPTFRFARQHTSTWQYRNYNNATTRHRKNVKVSLIPVDFPNNPLPPLPTSLPAVKVACPETATPLDYTPLRLPPRSLSPTLFAQPQILPHRVGGFYSNDPAQDAIRPLNFTLESLMETLWTAKTFRIRGDFEIAVDGVYSGGLVAEVVYEDTFKNHEVRNHDTAPNYIPDSAQDFLKAPYTHVRNVVSVNEEFSELVNKRACTLPVNWSITGMDNGICTERSCRDFYLFDHQNLPLTLDFLNSDDEVIFTWSLYGEGTPTWLEPSNNDNPPGTYPAITEAEASSQISEGVGENVWVYFHEGNMAGLYDTVYSMPDWNSGVETNGLIFWFPKTSNVAKIVNNYMGETIWPVVNRYNSSFVTSPQGYKIEWLKVDQSSQYFQTRKRGDGYAPLLEFAYTVKGPNNITYTLSTVQLNGMVETDIYLNFLNRLIPLYSTPGATYEGTIVITETENWLDE